MESWHEVGPHRYRCEPGGILFLRLEGDLEAKHMQALIEPWSRLCDERGSEGMFWLIDMSRLGTFTKGARELITSIKVRPEDKGTVIFGASFTVATVVTMLNKAGRLLQGDHVTPVRFRPTEAEARACIEESRRTLRRGT